MLGSFCGNFGQLLSGHATAVACALDHRCPDDKYAAMAKARFEHAGVVRHL